MMAPPQPTQVCFLTLFFKSSQLQQKVVQYEFSNQKEKSADEPDSSSAAATKSGDESPEGLKTAPTDDVYDFESQEQALTKAEVRWKTKADRFHLSS